MLTARKPEGVSCITGTTALRSSTRHRCTTLALSPCKRATLATDAPGCRHACSTFARSSALCLRRGALLMTLSIVSTLFMWTTMPVVSCKFNMTWPVAYGARNTQVLNTKRYLPNMA